MANPGLIIGRVTSQGSPARALVNLKWIRAHGQKLTYWNPKWPDNPKAHVPSVYTDNDGIFEHFFWWDPTDVGIVADPAAQFEVGVLLSDTVYSHYRTARGRLVINVNTGKLILSMFVGVKVWTQHWLAFRHIKLPKTFTGSATITYTPELYVAAGITEIDFD